MAILNLVQTPEKTYQANGAIASSNLRVYFSAGKALVAAAANLSMGTSRTAAADGDYVAVQRIAGLPEAVFVASGAIAVGQSVFGAAGGKVSATTSADVLGFAQTAAGADGDQILVLLDKRAPNN